MKEKILALMYLIFGLTLSAQTTTGSYGVVPDNPRPGEPVAIGTSAGSGARTVALMVDGRRLARATFFTVPSEGVRPAFMAAILAVPSTARVGSATIVVEGAAGTLSELALQIAQREFRSEVLTLTPSLTGILNDSSPQRVAESEHLWAILNRIGNEAHFFGSFVPPVSSTRRTSQFGSRRVFRYSNGGSDTSIHAGVDYGVPTGTAVGACAPGRVVLARHRIVSGNSIIVEHLPGVYSLYYHLDSIEVAEGDLVAAGALLGRSGSTGFSTGPHLHWEIRVATENTDPDVFFTRPLLDIDAILSKINQ